MSTASELLGHGRALLHDARADHLGRRDRSSHYRAMLGRPDDN